MTELLTQQFEKRDFRKSVSGITDQCHLCGKTVYPVEKVVADSKVRINRTIRRYRVEINAICSCKLIQKRA